MKTNNRLSKDNNNSVSVVKQHRPMVKEEILPTKFGINIIGNHIERPMNDTEYIEYLEKENQELKKFKEHYAEFCYETKEDFLIKLEQQQAIKEIEKLTDYKVKNIFSWEITFYKGDYKLTIEKNGIVKLENFTSYKRWNDDHLRVNKYIKETISRLIPILFKECE